MFESDFRNLSNNVEYIGWHHSSSTLNLEDKGKLLISAPAVRVLKFVAGDQ
jgi:hypothetical protein